MENTNAKCKKQFFDRKRGLRIIENPFFSVMLLEWKEWNEAIGVENWKFIWKGSILIFHNEFIRLSSRGGRERVAREEEVLRIHVMCFSLCPIFSCSRCYRNEMNARFSYIFFRMNITRNIDHTFVSAFFLLSQHNVNESPIFLSLLFCQSISVVRFPGTVRWEKAIKSWNDIRDMVKNYSWMSTFRLTRGIFHAAGESSTQNLIFGNDRKKSSTSHDDNDALQSWVTGAAIDLTWVMDFFTFRFVQLHCTFQISNSTSSSLSPFPREKKYSSSYFSFSCTANAGCLRFEFQFCLHWTRLE